MAGRRTVLFFTNSDFGQANVVLSTIYELLRQNRLDTHVVSWAPLQPRLESLERKVQDENPSQSVPSITFHNLASFPGFLEFAKKNANRRKADVPHPPGRLGAERIALLAVRFLSAWGPEAHLALLGWAADLTKELDPALVVVDPHLVPVHDMARSLKRKYAVLSPCTLAEENAVYDPQVKAINEARSAQGLHEPLGSFTPWVKDVPHICPSLPEIDLPLSFPANVHNCGPIMLPTPPMEESDPDLLAWLQKRPTVLMALGTHFEAYAATVREQAIGLRVLLDARPDIQVLWKLKAEETSEGDGKESLNTILGEQIENGRVRIESWLKPDPVAILRSGHIVCAVHHGGGNSYFESTWAGVPHVILAMWYDTFDYATRIEYLGIGVYGNRAAGRNCVVNKENYQAPLMVDGQEFGDALLKVVGRTKGDSYADIMSKKAAQLGEVCRKSGGRSEAARIITELSFEDAFYSA
ncbi:hypothetical protein EKO27_g8139 [Xylaria grammica]|uniref:Glycosyltransferase family 28 N-terminal domain-containing protein n=1 Tax=Xylaria grammica TaxID=363999 RepID=A0A439CY71_9PEZI|nr:hypothetical protein EKO27_g8139 [Xylaria grammica]